jgi:hypothetical protein
MTRRLCAQSVYQHQFFKEVQRLRISETSECFEAISEEMWRRKSDKNKRKLLAKKTIVIYGGEIGRYGGIKEMKESDLSRILVVNQRLIADGKYSLGAYLWSVA